MRSVISCLGAVCFVGAFFLFASSAVAGEILQSTPRLSTSSLRGRTIKPSTNAATRLQRMKPSQPTMSFSATSPYEYRIIEHERAETAYDAKLAAWQAKVEKMQTKNEEKSERERQRRSDKVRRERQRQLEKEARAHKSQERESSSFRSLFSRSEKSTEAKSKKSEVAALDDRLQTTSKPKLSFWQRLKRAFFGA